MSDITIRYDIYQIVMYMVDDNDRAFCRVYFEFPFQALTFGHILKELEHD